MTDDEMLDWFFRGYRSGVRTLSASIDNEFKKEFALVISANDVEVDAKELTGTIIANHAIVCLTIADAAINDFAEGIDSDPLIREHVLDSAPYGEPSVERAIPIYRNHKNATED